jgi:Zn-dependent protease
MKFSKREIFALLKAWIVISLAFAILFYDGKTNYFIVFLASLLTAGLGFLLHELAHKLIAQRYKLYAEFHSFDFMLLLALAFSFFGFIFAAPGAVFIHGEINKKKNGIISMAGPLTNIGLAIIFFIMLKFNFISFISEFGFRINSLLALFNMIPIMSFDGHKVLEWNKIVFTSIITIAALLVLLQFV